MDQNDINKLRGKTAVVGLAESGCGLASGWSAMEIMATAVHDALDDSGIKLNLVQDYFELFFPLYSSNGFEPTQDFYTTKIRFLFYPRLSTLSSLFTRKWF